MDYMVKLFKYRSSGVKEYWIVDPIKERILIYNFIKNDLSEYIFSELIYSGIFNNLKISI